MHVTPALATWLSFQSGCAGADACGEETPRASFVVNMTHIIGLFTYALVLGIVFEDVQSTVDGFKAGNTAIVERGHTVVLNQNRTTASLLRQVAPVAEQPCCAHAMWLRHTQVRHSHACHVSRRLPRRWTKSHICWIGYVAYVCAVPVSYHGHEWLYRTTP
jgi:hypothetical protein